MQGVVRLQRDHHGFVRGLLQLRAALQQSLAIGQRAPRRLEVAHIPMRIVHGQFGDGPLSALVRRLALPSTRVLRLAALPRAHRLLLQTIQFAHRVNPVPTHEVGARSSPAVIGPPKNPRDRGLRDAELTRDCPLGAALGGEPNHLAFPLAGSARAARGRPCRRAHARVGDSTRPLAWGDAAPDCRAARKGFPTVHRDLHIARIEVHRVTHAAEFFRGNEGRPAPAERIEQRLPGPRVIQQRDLKRRTGFCVL